MDNIKQFIAGKALVVKDDKILILRERAYDEGTNAGRWGFPGGRVKPGEDFRDGLKREVAEESGLEVEIIRPLHVDEWRPVIKGEACQIVGVFYECQITAGEVMLSEEHDQYEWADLGDYDKYQLMPEDREAWKKYSETDN